MFCVLGTEQDFGRVELSLNVGVWVSGKETNEVIFLFKGKLHTI